MLAPMGYKLMKLRNGGIFTEALNFSINQNHPGLFKKPTCKKPPPQVSVMNTQVAPEEPPYDHIYEAASKVSTWGLKKGEWLSC